MANGQQCRGVVTKEAEQLRSGGGKGPLPCILLSGSQGEAAAICAHKCCFYLLCNGRAGCCGGHSGCFSTVVIQCELQQFESSSKPLSACVDCGAGEPATKAER